MRGETADWKVCIRRCARRIEVRHALYQVVFMQQFGDRNRDEVRVSQILRAVLESTPHHFSEKMNLRRRIEPQGRYIVRLEHPKHLQQGDSTELGGAIVITS
jgi:hypothetical protein